MATAHLMSENIIALKAHVAELEPLAEIAWGIIANANGGDWDTAHADWRAAAMRWRDRYFVCLEASPLNARADAIENAGKGGE